MKRFMVVHASKAEIGEEVFAHLRRIVPGESSTTFHAKLRDDSAEYAEVLRTLQEAGCVARGKFEESRPGTFLLQPNYEYEKADFDRASYFLMLPHADVKLAGGRAPDGTVDLQANGLAGKGPLLIGFPGCCLCRRRSERTLKPPALQAWPSGRHVWSGAKATTRWRRFRGERLVASRTGS